MEKKRMEYLDVAKAFGIIIVCYVHAVTTQENINLVPHAYGVEFATQFVIPLFFFVGGILFSDKHIKNPVISSIKKIKAFYIPFVIYCLIFLVFNNLFVKCGILNEAYDYKLFAKHFIEILTMHVQPLGGAMWFLRAMLITVLLFIWGRFIVLNLVKTKYNEVLFAGVIIIIAILGNSRFCPKAFNIDKSFKLIIFYYLGFLYKKFNLNSFIQKYKIPTLLIGFGINAIIAYFFRIGINGYNMITFWLFVFTGVIGSVMILAIAQLKFIEKSKVLNCIGNKSLDIMCLHFLTYKIVSAIIVVTYDLPLSVMSNTPVIRGIEGFWWILYMLVGIPVAIGLRLLYDTLKDKSFF